jgi:hypothetical protein
MQSPSMNQSPDWKVPAQPEQPAPQPPQPEIPTPVPDEPEFPSPNPEPERPPADPGPPPSPTGIVFESWDSSSNGGANLREIRDLAQRADALERISSNLADLEARLKAEHLVQLYRLHAEGLRKQVV